jgi:hypothetical protein
MKIAALRLLIVVALASAQLGGIAHSLSHFKNSPRDGLPAGALHHCVVCDAYNVFDHGISGATTSSPDPLAFPAPPSAAAREFVAAAISPFSIRAPPA